MVPPFKGRRFRCVKRKPYTMGRRYACQRPSRSPILARRKISQQRATDDSSGRERFMAIQKVGVVGCGLMGSGIAQVSAQAGFATVVREISPNALEKGMGSIQKFLKGGVEKGKLTAEAMATTLANLKGTV